MTSREFRNFTIVNNQGDINATWKDTSKVQVLSGPEGRLEVSRKRDSVIHFERNADGNLFLRQWFESKDGKPLPWKCFERERQRKWLKAIVLETSGDPQ